MIVVLLLIIVCILLFGSSAVLGVFGIILGCIAGVFALGAAMSLWESLTLGGQILLICAPIVAVIGRIGILSLTLSSGSSLPTPSSPSPPQPSNARGAFSTGGQRAPTGNGRLNPNSATALYLSFDKAITGRFSPDAHRAIAEAVKRRDREALQRVYDNERDRLAHSTPQAETGAPKPSAADVPTTPPADRPYRASWYDW